MESIETGGQLLGAVREVVGTFGNAWWRGQPAGKQLLPGAYRCDGTHRMEWLRVTRFMQKAAMRQSAVPRPEEYAHWLFLMQHHRLPTRLLDWTESPLVACFFAVSSDNRSEDALLWALDPVGLNDYQLEEIGCFPGVGLVPGSRTPGPGGNTFLEVSDFIEPAFQQNEYDAPVYKRVLALLTPETNVRMLQQQSVFTAHGTRVPMEELNKCERFLRSFTIPAAAKTILWKELLWLGIRESSLYPDLDHLALDVCQTIALTS